MQAAGDSRMLGDQGMVAGLGILVACGMDEVCWFRAMRTCLSLESAEAAEGLAVCMQILLKKQR